MINVGLAGIGFMGWIHTLAYQATDGITLRGFASGNPAKRRGDWTSISGNFGPPGERIDVSQMSVHDSLDGLLSDPAIDLIDICLPPHLHADAIGRSIAAGKHVLCEKPLALTAEQSRELADLSTPNSMLLVAHILPMMAEYRYLVDAADDGRFGKLRSMRLKRFISPPHWIDDFYDPATVGGPLIDLHVHDAHLIELLLGTPDTVHTAGDTIDGEYRRYETLMTYADGRYASSGGGVIDSPARGFTHGYEAIFDDATVQFEFAAYHDTKSNDDCTASIPLTVLHNNGHLEHPETGDPETGDPDPVAAFIRQAAAVAAAITTGQIPPALSPHTAAAAIALCQRQSP